jgi:hypothetical protein
MLKPAIRMNLLRAIAGFWILLSFALDYLFGVGEVGYSAQSKSGQTHISAGSHPAILVWCAVGVALFLVVIKIKPEETPDGVPSLGRRSLAFIIDFLFSLTIVATFGGLLPLWVESTRTGHFSWHFARDYSVPSDEIFVLPLVLLSMALMWLYFTCPLTYGRQTLGCFVLRLKVTPPFGDRGAFTFREAIRRTWYEFQGVCSPLRIREGRDSSGRTWYDRETNCTVVLVRYE